MANSHWTDDYARALEAARGQDKPLIVCFADAKTDDSPKTLLSSLGRLVDDFVVLSVDKGTPAGKRIYDLFEVTESNAWVVIDRTQQWQFSRYDRKLTRAELETLLRSTRTARGLPSTGDVILAAQLRQEARQPVRYTAVYSSSCFS
jgi:hypothetical protein